MSPARATYEYEHGFAVDRAGLIYYRVMPKVGGASNIEVSPEGPPPGMKVGDSYALRIKTDGSLADSLLIPTPSQELRNFVVMAGDGDNYSFNPRFHVAISPAGA